MPNWYKSVLFNELYFISDGGSIWLDVNDDTSCDHHQIVKEFGRFGYLEGHEYRMINTYDVHFYASFALLKLFPKLQLSLQYEIASTINKESKNKIKFLDGTFQKQKSTNSLPHDLGDPYLEPWTVINAYNSFDTSNWKDLNLKFILSVYRDFYYLNDFDFLEHMWPYIKDIMIKVQSQDRDHDGLIDSEGKPDQTYV